MREQRRFKTVFVSPDDVLNCLALNSSLPGDFLTKISLEVEPGTEVFTCYQDVSTAGFAFVLFNKAWPQVAEADSAPVICLQKRWVKVDARMNRFKPETQQPLASKIGVTDLYADFDTALDVWEPPPPYSEAELVLLKVGGDKGMYCLYKRYRADVARKDGKQTLTTLRFDCWIAAGRPTALDPVHDDPNSGYMVINERTPPAPSGWMIGNTKLRGLYVASGVELPTDAEVEEFYGKRLGRPHIDTKLVEQISKSMEDDMVDPNLSEKDFTRAQQEWGSHPKHGEELARIGQSMSDAGKSVKKFGDITKELLDSADKAAMEFNNSLIPVVNAQPAIMCGDFEGANTCIEDVHKARALTGRPAVSDEEAQKILDRGIVGPWKDVDAKQFEDILSNYGKGYSQSSHGYKATRTVDKDGNVQIGDLVPYGDPATSIHTYEDQGVTYSISRTVNPDGTITNSKPERIGYRDADGLYHVDATIKLKPGPEAETWRDRKPLL